MIGPGLLVAVVALALAGRGSTGGPSADRVTAAVALAESSPATGSPTVVGQATDPAPVASAAPAWRSDWPAAISRAQRLASDAYVNRFTIDDVGEAPPTFVTTPPWVHALAVIGRDRSDPFQR